MLFNSRKGQGLSMNVIIIAALALLVLVILAVLLINSTGQIVEGQSCEALGGECSNDDSCATGEVHRSSGDESCGEEIWCCIPLTGE